MKILMLGGTGYLGGNLVKALRDDGHEITCTVRPSSRTDHLADLPGIKLITDKTAGIDAELAGGSYDWVINAVCTYKRNDSLYMDMLDANYVFPAKVLNLAAKHHVQNFLTAGTSLPVCFNMYSFTKGKLAETGQYFSVHEGLINFIELQLEMFYGNYPGGRNEPSGRFLRGSMEKLCRNERLKLTKGLQKRDIIHVEDAVNLVLRVIRAGFEGFRSLPVGTGEHHSIREIMEFLRGASSSESVLEFGAVPDRAGGGGGGPNPKPTQKFICIRK